MYLRIVDDKPVKYSISQLRNEYPRTSFPRVISTYTLESYGVYPYKRPEPPAVDPITQTLSDGTFYQENGSWMLGYEVTQITEEQASFNVREKRDELLKETDWRFRSDMTPSTEWIAYCQALRDIPQQNSFPFSVTWPDKPNL